jgi:hypothetical protein
MQYIMAPSNKILQTSIPTSSPIDSPMYDLAIEDQPLLPDRTSNNLTFGHFSNQTSATVPSAQPESSLPTSHYVHPHSNALIMSRTPHGPRYGAFAGNGVEYANILQMVMAVSTRYENENLELKEQLQNLRAAQQKFFSQLTEMLGKCWVNGSCSMDCDTCSN